jgi:hypothetical protein
VRISATPSRSRVQLEGGACSGVASDLLPRLEQRIGITLNMTVGTSVAKMLGFAKGLRQQKPIDDKWQ